MAIDDTEFVQSVVEFKIILSVINVERNKDCKTKQGEDSLCS